MHVPAWPVYPDQTPAMVAQAFRTESLGALKGVCDDLTGICYDDYGNPTVSQTYVDPSLYLYEEPALLNAPAGTLVNVPTATGTATYQNQGTAQSPNYVPVLAAATAGAIDIAKLLAVQPGTVQQGSTTLRQNPGYAVPTPTTSTGVSVQASTGGSILIAAGVALAAAFLLFGRNR